MLFMKKRVIVLGRALENSRYFIEYLIKEIRDVVGDIDESIFIDKSDDLSSIIRDRVENSRYLFIIAYEDILLVAKILATISSDTLTHKSNMLLPSKVKSFSKNSYLLELDGTTINILNITDTLGKIPEILIEKDLPVKLFLLSSDIEADKFYRLAKLFRVELFGALLIDELREYTLYAKSKDDIDLFLQEARDIVDGDIFFGSELSKVVVDILIKSNKQITTAESCTGGLISSEIVKYSGVSKIFKGSVIVYDNEFKSSILGVKESTLREYGAVSFECVEEMLVGAQKLFNTDFSIAVSGVAGPDGGTIDKPVGRVFVGVKNRDIDRAIIRELDLKGDRNYIQKSAMLWAFKLLILSDRELFLKFMPKILDK